MGSSKKQTVGHRYFFGIHMGVSRGPIDELVEIKVGDSTVWKTDMSAPPLPSAASVAALAAWRAAGSIGTMPGTAQAAYDEEQRGDRIEWPMTVTESATIDIRAGEIFGGDDGEGGISGKLDVMMGEEAQGVNPKLAAMLGGIVPGFRGVFTAFFDGLVTSISKYPKPWSMRVRRATKGWDGGPWYADKAVIWLANNAVRAMNPAHIIYECLTNRDWGRGVPRVRIDDTVFKAAADVFYEEGFGLCLRWARQDSINQFLQAVLDHVGAVLFEDPVTGLWKLRPMRDDYDVETLPLFTPESGLISIDEDETSAQPVGTNEIIIEWRNPIDNKDRQVRAQNLAAINGAAGIISETLQYPGIPTHALSARVAMRELRQKIAAKKFKVRLDRRGYELEPGMAFRVSDTQHGIENIVLRAGRIDDGTIAKGIMTVDAAVDVFGLPSTTYVTEQEGTWSGLANGAEPVVHARLEEVTWRDLVASLPQSEVDTVSPGVGLVSSLAVQPTPLSLNYELETRVGSAQFTPRGNGDFVSTAILATAMPIGAEPRQVAITDAIALANVEVGSPALIDSEIMRVDAIDTVGLTIVLARGCIDTVPASHSAGARIWFYDSTVATDTTEYAASVTVDARLLTRTSKGRLAPADAAPLSVLTTARLHRPYPPGRLRINNLFYPESLPRGDIRISWSHRDRHLQADQVIDTLVGDVGPELDTTYLITIKNELGNTVVDDNIDGLSYDFPAIADNGVSNYLAERDINSQGLQVMSNPLGDAIASKRALSRFGSSWFEIIGNYSQGFETKLYNEGGATVTYNTPADPEWNNFVMVSDTFRPDVFVAQYMQSGDQNYIGFAIARLTSPNPPFTTLHEPYTVGGANLLVPVWFPGDRRLTHVSKYKLAHTADAVIGWWANSWDSVRAIYYAANEIQQFNDISSGPMSRVRHPLGTGLYYHGQVEQFDSPTGKYVAEAPFTDDPEYSFYNDYFGSKVLDVFDGLLYGRYVAGKGGASNTAGKAVDITNVLTNHIDVYSQKGMHTDLFAIDGDTGDLTLISSRSGYIQAADIGGEIVEINGSVARKVNASTGAFIGSLPSIAQTPHAVVGDSVNHAFYILGRNFVIYKYDASGSLLSSYDLKLSMGEFEISDPSAGKNAILYCSADTLFVQLGTQGSPHWTGIAWGAVFALPKTLASCKRVIWREVTGFEEGLPTVDNSVMGIIRFAHPSSHYIHVDLYGANTPMAAIADERATISDAGLIPASRPSELTLELAAVRGGVESFQKHKVTVARRGWGMQWGKYWGG